MAAMNVTALSDLGYDEKTRFIDPMEDRYRQKPFVQSDFAGRSGPFSDTAIQDKVDFFTNLEAYKNVAAVESRLEAYWATAKTASTATTTAKATATTATTLKTTTSKVSTTTTPAATKA